MTIKLTGLNTKCELCKQEALLQKHHYIPQMVLKELKIPISKYIINICDQCHHLCHNHILTHLSVSGDLAPMGKYHAVRYLLMRKYLETHHSAVFKDFKEWYKSYVLSESMEECNNDPSA